MSIDPEHTADIRTLPNPELWVLALGPRLGRAVARKASRIRALSARSVGEIAVAYDLPEDKATRISAVLELGKRLAEEPLRRGSPFRSSHDVFRHYHARMRDLKVEQFRVILVDGKHRVMSEHLISQGTLTSSPVHPREVFSTAIRENAAGIVLVHNHPSGDPSPSCDDLEITRRLAEVGDLVGIRVLDHVVVGDGKYVSLADRGLLLGT